MEYMAYIFFGIALVAPIFLVLYDVLIPKVDFIILREKIFLKLGILGVYAYPLSPYCLGLVLLTFVFIMQSNQKSPYDILCVVFVSIVFSLFLIFFDCEGEDQVVPLLLLFVFALCVGLILIVLSVLHFLKKGG